MSVKWVDCDLLESPCKVDFWEESGLNVADILNEMILFGKRTDPGDLFHLFISTILVNSTHFLTFPFRSLHI